MFREVKRNKKKTTQNRAASRRKIKAKKVYNVPEYSSEESSLDGNYLENYSTESDYSDNKLHLPEELSSADEFIQADGPCVPLFSSANEKGKMSVGTEYSEARLNKYFDELRKSDPSSFNPDTVFKPKANGDFLWPGFKKTPPDIQNQKSTSRADTSNGTVKPPDPRSVPEVVLRLNSIEDVLQNRKVVEYLNQLEAAENDVNRRLEANLKVRAEEVEALQAAKDAILRKFGYDFTDKEEVRRNERKTRRHQMRKNEFPCGESVSSSTESDDSERPLKEEVARRYLSVGQEDISELNFADLMKHSPRWMASVKEEMSGNDFKGKIENMIKLTDKVRVRRNEQ